MNKLILPIIVALLVIAGCQHSTEKSIVEEPRGADNIAYQWGKIALEATANDTDMFKPRPTITSRFLGLIFTSMFDAWTRYDQKATPVYLTGVERRPMDELTLENKEIAISYAAYRAMSEYYYSDSTMYRNFMTSMGLDPNDESLDPSTPVGIGNLAAKAVIAARHNDGSNQYGEQSGASKQPYYDYTEYQPINTVDNNVELNRWQPKYFSDKEGKKFAPGCLTPYWQLVKPLMLDSASQFRPGPPPMVGSEQLAAEVKEVVDLQANLTDENRALVEFMRDGPKSVQQAGHWLLFAQQVSIRDQHTLDDDIKMYFYVESVAMDGFIACWDSKMYYDFARPFALVHDYYQDETIKAWGGPEVGMTEMKGQEWRPYSPNSFLCPPFPSYVSGHSTISGGCAEALRLFTGSDEFGSSVDLVPGIMTEPDNLGDTVTLHFPTFTKAGEMAGISRVMGGYHIQADNIEGLNLGRNIARDIYKKFQILIGEGKPETLANSEI
ncbi:MULTISPECIES: vanadium-dependent haloperoxidase [Reichenbachiella]|uniref:vanadium-dependent haloperoxidase n=1 Tax=Reichenbachiella TaxID=156993 RepID=UPI000E6C65DC|nr:MULTISPECIES: vanadium-dependent haloperoxidase [Reichenbachiella]MBU2913352.1 vanadium-dependent haloperoxidase [Reichenbachiella agariperforans]RJE74664.1 haloperoxidase [Reichenbachiella sp. MSK19-1]